MIVLNPDLSKALGEQPFDDLMKISGQVYRKQPMRETLRISINQHDYFIKKHSGTTLKECLKNWFSGRMPVIGAKPEWKAIQALTKLGIHTTPFVGYGQRGLWPLTQESFLLTKALNNTVSLEDLCAQWATNPPDFQDKYDLIKEVARTTRILHSNGWVHRDYYLCHFLRDQDKQLYLIDLHRMQQPRFRLQRWIIKDLAGLLFSSLNCGLSRSDVLRFLKAYTQLPLRQILGRDAKLLKTVISRASALYHRSYHDYPLQTWMNPGEMRLPKKLGTCHQNIILTEGVFQSLEALRILPGRRWVLKGYWDEKLAVMKLFMSRRDYLREISGAQALRNKNILSPSIIQKGRLNNLYFLIYEFIDQGTSLEKITLSLMKTMAQMHQVGIIQTDCHRDNFLQCGERIYVLDAAGILVDNYLDEAAALYNLALLFAQWPERDDHKHFSCFSSYLQTRGWNDTPAVHARLAQDIRFFRLKRRDSWLNKIFRDCSAVRVKSRFTRRYCIQRDFDTLYTQTLCVHPESYFHCSATYLKNANSATLVRTKIGEREVVIKRYNRKNLINRLKRYFSTSKAARAWKAAHAIDCIGIQTPRPLAFIENRFGLFGLDSYFVCDFIHGKQLDHFVRSNPSLPAMQACAHALINMMYTLEAAHCEHCDLKAPNILWDGKSLFLIDTDAVVFYRNVAAYQKAHQADWHRLLRNWDDENQFKQLLIALKSKGGEHA